MAPPPAAPRPAPPTLWAPLPRRTPAPWVPAPQPPQPLRAAPAGLFPRSPRGRGALGRLSPPPSPVSPGLADPPRGAPRPSHPLRPETPGARRAVAAVPAETPFPGGAPAAPDGARDLARLFPRGHLGLQQRASTRLRRGLPSPRNQGGRRPGPPLGPPAPPRPARLPPRRPRPCTRLGWARAVRTPSRAPTFPAPRPEASALSWPRGGRTQKPGPGASADQL